MGNRIEIGDNNQLKDTNIAGNNVSLPEPKNKKSIWNWVLRHIEAIIAAIISGAVSALVSWLITYFCFR